MTVQTLYIYCGVAAVVGVIAGTLLHYTTKILAAALGMNRMTEERGRTVASYRAELAEKEAKKARHFVSRHGLLPKIDMKIEGYSSDWLKSPVSQGLQSTTILEEDDSSDAGFA